MNMQMPPYDGQKLAPDALKQLIITKPICAAIVFYILFYCQDTPPRYTLDISSYKLASCLNIPESSIRRNLKILVIHKLLKKIVGANVGAFLGASENPKRLVYELDNELLKKIVGANVGAFLGASDEGNIGYIQKQGGILKDSLVKNSEGNVDTITTDDLIKNKDLSENEKIDSLKEGSLPQTPSRQVKLTTERRKELSLTAPILKEESRVVKRGRKKELTVEGIKAPIIYGAKFNTIEKIEEFKNPEFLQKYSEKFGETPELVSSLLDEIMYYLNRFPEGVYSSIPLALNTFYKRFKNDRSIRGKYYAKPSLKPPERPLTAEEKAI
jgi:hypothetical protein